MPPLRYHAGQIEVQEEANTLALAEHLSHWVGPVAEFAEMADLILLAAAGDDGALRFTILSGPVPLVDITPRDTLRLRIPSGGVVPSAGRCGGLAINLGLARRVRINGDLTRDGDGCELDPVETFTLCRKYMAPSLTCGEEVTSGPTSRRELQFDDAAAMNEFSNLLSRSETMFLASIAPDGGPDVAHRGGPPGFVLVDLAKRTIEWPEFLGDGIFKSAGNVRATGVFTLLVPDFDSGAAFEILCRDGAYKNVRTSRSQRLDPLVQVRDPHPLQGTITATIDRVMSLSGALHARRHIPHALRVTSSSTVDEQAPQ